MAGIDYAVPIVAAVLGAYPAIREARKEKAKKNKDFIAAMVIGTVVLVAVSSVSIYLHNKEASDAKAEQRESDRKISGMISQIDKLRLYIHNTDSARHASDSTWHVKLLAAGWKYDSSTNYWSFNQYQINGNAIYLSHATGNKFNNTHINYNFNPAKEEKKKP